MGQPNVEKNVCGKIEGFIGVFFRIRRVYFAERRVKLSTGDLSLVHF